MKRVVLLVLAAFVVSICAWPAGAAYDPLSSSRTERAKAEAFNGKMELLVRDVGKLADQIAAYNKPAFEVRLTREERQYQEMGEDNYRTSRILYNRVWAKDKTLVLGEARGDKRFYATFLTTIDPEYSFVGGIRVGAGTKILENFFGDSIMNAGNVEGQKVTLTGPDYGPTDGGPDHVNITCVNGVITEIRLYRSGSYVFSFKALDFANKRLHQMGLANIY